MNCYSILMYKRPKNHLEDIIKYIIVNNNTLSIQKCNMMKYYKIMKNEDCEEYLLITYMEDFLSIKKGMCVISIHNVSKTYIDENCYVGLDGLNHDGVLFDLNNKKDRTKMKKYIMNYIN